MPSSYRHHGNFQTSGEASDPQGGAENVQEGDVKQQPPDSDHQLQPLNTRMLQGAFYVLIIGYCLSGRFIK